MALSGDRLEYLHVDNILGKVGNGCTDPLDACLSSRERAIIKPYNNMQGNLVLVNEYICYRICKKLDIPIPEAGIAVVDDNTVYSCDDLILSEDNYGYCFYSRRIDKVAVVNRAIIPRISNVHDFYKIILFDHLVYNKDRNKGNLLVTSGKSIDLYAIDHTHVFKNETIWDSKCLQRGMVGCDYKDRDIIESNQWIYNLFWEYLKKDKAILLQLAHEFKSKIQCIDLEMFINELPDAWQIPEQEAIALKEYLIYRLDHIEEMCSLISGR